MLTIRNFASSLVTYHKPIVAELVKIHSKLNCSLADNSSRQIKLGKEKEERVLAILNNDDKDNLLRYPISKIRIEKIRRMLLKNGSIGSLDDLLQLDGFGRKMLEKMCETILRYEDNLKSLNVQPSPKRSGTFTIPTLSVTSSDQYQSVISIYTSISTIAWSRITLNGNGPCHLSHWHFYDLGEKRMHLSDLARSVNHFVRNLPQADCYVMDNPQVAQATAPGGAEQVNINVQRAQIVAMLNYGFLSQCDAKQKQRRNVFYLKKYLSSRIFNTLVGNERISTEQVVTDMMRTVYNVEDWIETNDELNKSNESLLRMRSNINFPMELRETYKNAERYQRDFLGQALLIGMTFIRLSLLREPESIAKVSPTSKADVVQEVS